MSLPWRTRAGRAATVAANAVSRRLRLGGGTVVGGRVGLAVDPGLLARLAAGRPVALVSGTNGKTTTTRLLAVALGGAGGDQRHRVEHAGRPRGRALAAGDRGVPVVLEVDEGYLPALVEATAPGLVVLLNLSRDQLDRTNEVRMLAGRWRRALAGADGTTVVANADDPLVRVGRGTAPRVVWVAAGLGWRLDAVGCPACEGRIEFGEGVVVPLRVRPSRPGGDGLGGRRGGRWRPSPTGGSIVLDLAIPGRFNRANAAMAAAAAEAMGVPAERALAAMAAVERGGRPVHHPPAGRAPDPAHAGQEPGRLGRAARPGLPGHHAGGGRDQRPGGRRAGPLVVVGRRRSSSCGPAGGGHRRALPRPGGAPALRRGAAHHGAPTRWPRWRAAGRRAAGEAQVEFIGNYTAFHDLLARR